MTPWQSSVAPGHAAADAAWPARAGASGRLFFQPETLVAAALAANLAVALCARHFPYQDAPNHLARYVLIDRILSGEQVPGAAFHWVPSSYIGIDLFGALLVHLFGPPSAEHILTAIAVILPTAGMYLLLRATAPGARGMALAGSLLTFSWFFMAGLLNFVIGFGLALCCMAWWWPRRRSAGWSTAATIAVAVGALFFIHLSAPLIVLGVMATTLAVELWGMLAVARAGDAIFPRAALRNLLAGTLAFAGVWWWASTATAVRFDLGTAMVFRSVPSKIAAFGAPFYSFSLVQAAFMAASYAALLALVVVRRRRNWPADPFLLSTLLFVGLFLVFPKDIGGAGGADVRWLMPALFLPFCSIAVSPERIRRPLLLAAFALSIGNAAVIWSYTAVIDRRLDDFDAVLRALPQASRVLPLISMKASYPRVTPYEQYAFWHVIDKRGQVPGLWSLTGSREGEPPLPHLQHFIISPRTYYPLDPVPLDWRRVAADYDYIVQASDEDSPRAYVGSHARELMRVGTVELYKVNPMPSGRLKGQIGTDAEERELAH